MQINITDFQEENLKIYTEFHEPELLHYYEPEPGVCIAESPNVIARGLRAGYKPISILMDEHLLQPEEKEREQTEDVLSMLPEEVPVYVAPRELLQQVKGFAMTRGMMAVLRRKDHPSLREILQGKHRVVVLENVMNPTNVGAIFRSAAALHMDAVILTKGCADPLYKRAARVSMGCVFQIPWTVVDTEAVDIQELHSHGFKTAAMALTEDAISIADARLKSQDKLAILMGTESSGLREKTVVDSDYKVIIPMAAGVDSLNVAAASAVACWELGNMEEISGNVEKNKKI